MPNQTFLSDYYSEWIDNPQVRSVVVQVDDRPVELLVSAEGHVYRPLHRITPYTHHLTPQGYRQVHISILGKQRAFLVKKLVAEAWVPKPPVEEPDLFRSVVERDLDLNNCWADNLEWRPQWWLVRYRKQFSSVLFERYGEHLVFDHATGATRTAFDVCVQDVVLLSEHIVNRNPIHGPLWEGCGPYEML